MSIFAAEKWLPAYGFEGRYEVSDFLDAALNRMCDEGWLGVEKKEEGK